MFDIIVTKLKEEIALNGPQGMSIADVWIFVQRIQHHVIADKYDTLTTEIGLPVIDDGYKSTLWPFLRRDSELFFYKGESDTQQVTQQPDQNTEHGSSPTVATIAESRIANQTPKSKDKGKARARAKPKSKTPKKKKRKAVDSDDDYEANDTSSESSDEEYDELDSSSEDETPKETGDNNAIQMHAGQTIPDAGVRQRTLIPDIRQMDYDHVKRQFGNGVWIVASEKLQLMQLKIGIPPGCTISPNGRIVMKTILQTRTKGITQAGLTRILGLDPRSTGHYVKVLEEKGVIVRKAVTISGVRTNLCVHVRFSRDPAIPDSQVETAKKSDVRRSSRPYNMNAKGVIFSTKDVRDKMAELLLGANDHVMFSHDIIGALGFNSKDFFVRKWFHRAVDTASAMGLVRKFSAQMNGVGRRMLCLQLVDPESVNKQAAMAKSADYVVKNSVRVYSSPQDPPVLLGVKVEERPKSSRLLRDQSLEHQVLCVVTNAGEKGVIQKEIQYAIGHQDSRSMYRLLETLSSLNDQHSTKYTLRRVIEFEGRSKRYRYYTLEAFSKVHKNTTVQITSPPPFTGIAYQLEDENWSNATSLKGSGRRPRKNRRLDNSDESDSSDTQSVTPAPGIKKQPPTQRKRVTFEDEVMGPVMEEDTEQSLAGRSRTPKRPRLEPEPPVPEKRGRPKKTARQSKSFGKNTAQSDSLPKPPLESGSQTAQSQEPEMPVETPTHLRRSSRQQKYRQTTLRVGSNQRLQMERGSSEPMTPPTPSRRSTRINHQPPTQTDLPHHDSSSTAKRKATSNVVPENTSRNQDESVHRDDSMACDQEPEQPITGTPDNALETRPGAEHPLPTLGDSTCTSSRPHPHSDRLQVPSKMPRRQRESITITPSGLRLAPHRNTHLQHNSYYEQRKKVLQALLDDKPVYERGKELMDSFLAKKAAMFPNSQNSGHTLTLKTLWSTAQGLAKEGVARVYENDIRLFNGETTTLKLLMRNDVEDDDPEIQKYVEILNDRKIYHPRTYKPRTIVKIDNVERLTDRLNRLEEEYTLHLDRNDMASAKALQEQIKKLRTNLNGGAALDYAERPESDRDWLLVGVQYGYITSKMLRAKLLHQYLYELSNRREMDATQAEPGVLTSTSIINEMTLSLFFKTIGLFSRFDIIANYIQNTEHLEQPLKDLPDEVRGVLFNEMNKCRRRLRNLLDTLCLLELLEVIQSKDMEAVEYVYFNDRSSNLPFAYRVKKSCTMYDYRSAGSPAILHYTFDGPTDVSLYWSELQYICTNIENTQTSSRQPENPNEEQLFRVLYAHRNWSNLSIYDRQQRRVLNSYIDYVKRKTPIKDISCCKRISAQLGIPMDMVRRYFRKAETSFTRNQKTHFSNAARKKRSTTRTTEIPASRQPISTTTRNVFARPQRGSTASRLLRLNRQSEPYPSERKTTLFQDDDRELPTIADRDAIDDLLLKKQVRKLWTSHDDELLQLCYILLKHRSRVCGQQFFWKSVKVVFPDRDYRNCRHRLYRLFKRPQNAGFMSTLSSIWRSYHQEGIRTGAISDGNTNDPEAFDILAHLEYFIAKLKENDQTALNIIEDPVLPNSLDQLYQVYDIELPSQSRESFEDIFHSEISLSARHDILCLNMYAIKGSWSDCTDDLPLETLPENDTNVRKVQLLQALFKMILMTPQETYDSFFAYGLLHQFPDHTLKKAVQEAYARGILIKSKRKTLWYRNLPGLNRELPGLPYLLALRFLERMAVELPVAYNTQAKAYEEYLNEHTTDRFSSVNVSSGMMGCMLDLLASAGSGPKLSLEIADKQQFLDDKLTPYTKNRLIDKSKNDFEITLKFNGPPRQSLSNAPILRTNTTCLTSRTFNTMQKCVMATQEHMEDGDCIGAVVDCLRNNKSLGANICGIKHFVLSWNPNVTDEQIRNAVKSLQYTIPPLLYEVGFEAPRYVLATYLDSWKIIPKPLRESCTPMEEASGFSKALATQQPHVISPRLWVNVKGEVTEAVQKGCLETIAEVVMIRPGITEARLAERFKNLLTRIEVRECLKELVQRKVLRTIVTAHQSSPKVTLFSKRRVYSKISHTQIERSAETSYFPMPGYYSNLV